MPVADAMMARVETDLGVDKEMTGLIAGRWWHTEIMML